MNFVILIATLLFGDTYILDGKNDIKSVPEYPTNGLTMIVYNDGFLAGEYYHMSRYTDREHDGQLVISYMKFEDKLTFR